MAHIPLDASFGPELVEFWGKKYKDVKEEIELLKVKSKFFAVYLAFTEVLNLSPVLEITLGRA
jgi:hypothetical protein